MTELKRSFPELLVGLVRLNARALRCVLANRWLTPSVYGASYDRLSGAYDASWRKHIEGVTTALLKRLPETGARTILDLGCGTGLSSRVLAAAHPSAVVTGIDISRGMLDVARNEQGPKNILYQQGDMLAFLETQADASCDLIFSAWALGYSKPGTIITQAGRVLKPGGTFAFVVNYADTLPDVFEAYKRTMIAYPGQLTLAMRPCFPPNRRFIETHLDRARFSTRVFNDDRVPITVQRSTEGEILPWLLKTGALAGFDQAMGLDKPGHGARYFESCLAHAETLYHHYAEAIAVKS